MQSANCLKMQNLFAIFYANGKITLIIHCIVQAVRISSVNCRNSGVLYMAPLLYKDERGFYLEFCTKDKKSQLVQGVVGPRWSLSVTRFNNIAILERFDSADNTVFPIQCHSGIIIAVIHLGTFLLFIPPVHRHCSGCPKNCIKL